MKYLWVVCLLMVMFTGTTGLVKAEQLSGREILQQMDQAMQVEQKYMEEEMVLKTASGTERSRTIAVWNSSKGEEDRMLLKFLSPSNLAGTGFLMADNDMWLYLPALGKVKRIAGSARQGSFMGSDLSYQDMEALGNRGFSADYKAELVGQKQNKKRRFYRLELNPEEGTDVTYGKLEVLVDRETMLPRKITYYDQDGTPLKELETSGHKQIDEHWTASQLTMSNLVKGSRTILKINQVDFNPEIDERIFTTRYLERGH